MGSYGCAIMQAFSGQDFLTGFLLLSIETFTKTLKLSKYRSRIIGACNEKKCCLPV
jgi:hypothetical protein